MVYRLRERRILQCSREGLELAKPDPALPADGESGFGRKADIMTCDREIYRFANPLIQQRDDVTVVHAST